MSDYRYTSNGSDVERVAIAAASAGDNALVAAVSGRKILVHALFIRATGAVTPRFESGAGGDAMSGVMSLAANDEFVLPYNEKGWMVTGAGALLNAELGGAVAIAGGLVYSVVD